MGPMVVSPHTTPPNTQLLMTAPSRPPLPNTISQRHLPMMTQVLLLLQKSLIPNMDAKGTSLIIN